MIRPDYASMGRQRLGLAHRALVRHGERPQRHIGRVDHLRGLTDRRSLAFVSDYRDRQTKLALGSSGQVDIS